MKTTLIGLAALAIVVAGVVLAGGAARLGRLFGPADLGPVTFETLQRRTTPNDALACPVGMCPAWSDVVPPVFALDVAGLRAALGKVIASEPGIERVASDDATSTDRYVQRTALLRFPDTIVVRTIALSAQDGAPRSTLALYSRSQLGHSDLGVNKARIERWLAKLGREVPAVW